MGENTHLGWVTLFRISIALERLRARTPRAADVEHCPSNEQRSEHVLRAVGRGSSTSFRLGDSALPTFTVRRNHAGRRAAVAGARARPSRARSNDVPWWSHAPPPTPKARRWRSSERRKSGRPSREGAANLPARLPEPPFSAVAAARLREGCTISRRWQTAAHGD